MSKAYREPSVKARVNLIDRIDREVMESPDMAEKVKDGWRQRKGSRSREAYMLFLERHAADLNPNAIDELIDWPDFDCVGQPALPMIA